MPFCEQGSKSINKQWLLYGTSKPPAGIGVKRNDHRPWRALGPDPPSGGLRSPAGCAPLAVQPPYPNPPPTRPGGKWVQSAERCTFGPSAPSPRGAARAGDGWLGEDGEGGSRVGWAASGASAWERRPPLSGSGPSARQGRWSFLFTPIPAGGLLV